MSSELTREHYGSTDEEMDEFVVVDANDLRSISELQAWLEPTDYLSPGNEYMKHIHSHIPGTGDWLRSSTEFDSWKRPLPQDTELRNNCLWIKGVPGSGKSVFTASIAKQLHDDGQIVLFFFFRQIVATNHNPKYLIRDWIAQLLPHSRWLHRQLDQLAKSNTNACKEIDTLWDALVQALDRMDKPVYCIADGLDEMDDTHADFIEKLKKLGAGGSSSSIKVLLTSRPIPRIEEILRDRTITAIKLDPTMLYPDITHYVQVRLNTLDPKLSVTKYQEVKEAICERAKGLFLHARLMTDNLITGLREGSVVEETLPTSLERLPRNLKELYTEMLAEHSRRSGITQDQQFMILQCVVHSSRPLRLIELGSLVMVLRSETGMGLKEGKVLVRKSCGRLLEILEDESVSVIHHSFTEFLRDTNREDGEGAFPILDKEKAHAMLVDISLKYLHKCEVSDDVLWENPDDLVLTDNEEETNDKGSNNEDDLFHFDDLDTGNGRSGEDDRKEAIVQDLRLKYPLLDYVISNLSHHVLKADSDDKSIFHILDDLFQPGRPAFTIWLLMEWKSYRPAKVTALHIAAYLNWQSYSEHLILKNVPVEQKDGEERTALSYAAEEGHTETVEVLLQYGAEPDADDRYGLKPMHYAAQKCKVGVVKQLLAKGVSPITLKTKTTPEMIAEQFGPDHGETPLEYVCQSGDVEIIKEFLPLLDQEWRQKAFGWVKGAENVEAVLQTGGISVDQIDDLRTKLYQAASDFQVDIVELLLKYGANPNARSKIKRNNVGSFSDGWPSPDGVSYPDGPTALHGWANYDYWHNSWDRDEKALECFKLLVDAGGDVHAEDGDGWTPLHCASKVQPDIMFGSWTDDSKDHLVEILLEAGVNPNAQTRHGSTPLHITRRPEVIDLLAKHGAQADIVDKLGQTPLTAYLAPSAEEMQSATIEKLLQISARYDGPQKRSQTPMHGLMRCMPKLADPKLFEILLREGVDPNTKDAEGTPPLLVIEKNDYTDRWGTHEISTNAYDEVFKTLRNAGMDMNITDREGRNVLHILLGGNDRKVSTLERFIGYGCDPLARDRQGATMLHYVMRKSGRALEMLDLFVRHGVDPLMVDRDGNTLVHELVRNTSDNTNYPTFLQELRKLRDLGVPTDAPNRDGRTPFHLICALWRDLGREKGFIGVFLSGESILCSNIDARDNAGGTPIHYAALTCETNVKLLLDASANPEVLTCEGLSPLHIAARARQPNTLGLLLNEYKKRGVLDHYVRLKHTAWPNWTALHYACSSGRPESVRYLIEAGADLNALDIRGLSPAHVVAEFEKHDHYGRGQMTRAQSRFSKYGDSIGVRLGDHPGYGRSANFQGRPPERTADIIEMLARAGAQLDYDRQKNSRLCEMTPMDLAVHHGCTEMVVNLRKRKYSARDAFGEKIVGRSGGNEEAEILLQIPNVDDAKATSRDQPNALTPFNMSPKEKIERVLTLADYDLLRILIGKSEELRLETLCQLVSWGHAFLLEEFLEGMENVDEKTTRKDSRGETDTLLGTACLSELPNLAVIRVLLEKAKVNVNACFQKESALHVLAKGLYFWHIEALEYLLSQGADVDFVVGQRTPLLSAASSDFGVYKDKTAAALLQHGADPNKVNSEGKSALYFAEEAEDVNILVKYGADPMLGTLSPLQSAIQHRRVDAVVALLQAGADPNTLGKSLPSQDSACYPLHEAAKRKDLYSIDEAALRLKKKEQIVVALLNHGADPMAMYDDGATVLQKVIEDHGLAAPLLRSPSLDLSRKGNGGRTPLISSCYPKTVLPPYSWEKDDEPLHSIAPDTAKYLIEKNVDLHTTDDQGRTALHWLCTLPLDEPDAPTRDIFTLLTTKAPSLINQPDHEGWTPIHLATTASQTRTMDALIAQGIDPKIADPDGNTPLHVLAPFLFGEKSLAEKAAQRFKHFLSLGLDINARNNDGSTPLALFIAQSHFPTSSSQPTRNRRTPDNVSPNHNTHSTYLPLFLSTGADIFTTNTRGESLLHLTAARKPISRYGRDKEAEEIKAVFGALLEMGLDPRAEDGECRTAIDVAVARGNGEVVELFREG